MLFFFGWNSGCACSGGGCCGGNVGNGGGDLDVEGSFFFKDFVVYGLGKGSTKHGKLSTLSTSAEINNIHNKEFFCIYIRAPPCPYPLL